MSKEYPLYDKMAQRFYRWEVVGDCKIKSFEPDITTCGVPEKTEQPKKEMEVRYCPIRAHRPKCNPHCALYAGNGCKIALEPAGNDTAGKSCPFDSYKCTGSCAMFNAGCGFIGYLERGLSK